jgi:hypothetical protein
MPYEVGRDSPLVPDLAESARLYMRLLLPAFSANWPTIAFAELMEREFGGFVPPPGYAG